MYSGPLQATLLVFEYLDVPVPPIINTQFRSLIQAATTLLGLLSFDLDLATRPNLLSNVLNPLTYDFIIVGAGSTGSVIANRLSENPNFNVLLLEAGGDPSVLHSIPLLALYNTNNEETDWLDDTVPQVNCSYSSEGRKVRLAHGKLLGGTSNLNFMVYMRGHPKDFDSWAETTGDPQWSYDNVLKYFKKSEDYHGNYPDPKYHGTGGPLHVTTHRYKVLENEWMAAARELGLNNTDANARQTQTFHPTEVNIKNGSRGSTYQAFLKPAMLRPNLFVLRNAHVTKINLDSSNRAVGVTYKRHGQIITVKASKEVILSAGAIGSPHLLMLSGIGPPEHLKSVGISPKVDLPGVGENLEDHVHTFLGPFLLNSSDSFLVDRDFTSGVATEYVVRKTGIGMFSTPDNKDQSWPNVAVLQCPVGIYEGFGADLEALFGLKEGILTTFFRNFVGIDATFSLLNVATPASKGTIKLRNKNPFERPLINPNYYKDPADMKAMIAGIKFMVAFFEETKAWKKHDAKLIPNALPGCERFALKSDEYYECIARTFTGTTWHPCCTARMGMSEDEKAVVDSNLRVRKVKGLRVADASIMPRTTNANINAPCIMIGEKAADLIKQAHSESIDDGRDINNQQFLSKLPVDLTLPSSL